MAAATRSNSSFTAKEKRAAARVVQQYQGLSLDSMATVAYRDAYPQCPDYPDFYGTDLFCVYAWVRVRDFVDFYRNRPSAQQFASGPKPYSGPSPLRTLDAKFAEGDPDPVWPVISSDPRGCQVNYLDVNGASHGLRFQRFGAPRGSSDWGNTASRYHVGHDCIANPGDIVVAPEAGEVINIRNFYAGTKGMFMETDTGLTIVLGEIEAGSNEDFGVTVGTRVSKGQHVARIGAFKNSAQLPYHMLHFETYKGRKTRNSRWYDGENRPKKLRNPTDYLLRASCNRSRPTSLSAPRPTSDIQKLGVEVMAVPSPRFPH